MPYILVRGNLASYGHTIPWRVLVSGLKATDIAQLTRFASGGYCDDLTIVYLQHPCVILTALEVLGYKVVASSSTSIKQDYNEYMWTMRKDFAEPEPVIKAVKDNDNDEKCNNRFSSKMSQSGNAVTGKLANTMNDENYYYVGVKASPFATDCVVFGLNSDEILALSKRFPNSGTDVVNGVMIKGPPFCIINALAELGYRVICSTGEAEILWTLQREL